MLQKLLPITIGVYDQEGWDIAQQCLHKQLSIETCTAELSYDMATMNYLINMANVNVTPVLLHGRREEGEGLAL
jgi:hypothetical protein